MRKRGESEKTTRTFCIGKTKNPRSPRELEWWQTASARCWRWWRTISHAKTELELDWQKLWCWKVHVAHKVKTCWKGARQHNHFLHVDHFVHELLDTTFTSLSPSTNNSHSTCRKNLRNSSRSLKISSRKETKYVLYAFCHLLSHNIETTVLDSLHEALTKRWASSCISYAQL